MAMATITCCVCNVEKCNHSKHLQTWQYNTIPYKPISIQYNTIQYNTIQYNTIHNAQTVIDIVTRLTTLQFCITALRAEVLQTEWNLPKMPVWNEKNDRQQGSGSPSGWAGHPFTGCCGASMVHNWILSNFTQSYSVESGTQEGATKRSVQVTYLTFTVQLRVFVWGLAKFASDRSARRQAKDCAGINKDKGISWKQRKEHLHTTIWGSYKLHRTLRGIANASTGCMAACNCSAIHSNSQHKRRARDGRQWNDSILDNIIIEILQWFEFLCFSFLLTSFVYCIFVWNGKSLKAARKALSGRWNGRDRCPDVDVCRCRIQAHFGCASCFPSLHDSSTIIDMHCICY